MNGMKRGRVGWLWMGLLTAAGFAFLAWAVTQDRTMTFDHRIIETVQGMESAGLTAIMKKLAWIGSTMMVAIISVVSMLAMAFLLGFRRQLALFLVVIGGSTLLGKVLKALFSRDRPNLHRLVEESGYSFPSASSLAAAALYGVIAYLLWKEVSYRALRILIPSAAVLIAAGIGISRIYLGVHYPSDVLGGWLAGTAWLALSIAVYESLTRASR